MRFMTQMRQTSEETPALLARAARRAAHGLIRAYQVTLSSLTGRQCRHLPTCSDFTDAAITRPGLWAGGWMGFGRICRCQPWGTAGYDPVADCVPGTARWWRPWGYAQWRGPLRDFRCEGAEGEWGGGAEKIVK